ncbi:MAG: creatininase family protein [Bacillota bacterium]
MLWEELNSHDFAECVKRANGTCVIPLGVVEKHGPHLPVGTDVFVVREVAAMAARIEPVVIFPWYYAGQISEARHVPGTISYSPELQWKMLEETCAEISRNGFDKIVIMNGHGGNNDMIGYFCQCSLHTPKDYVLYNIRAFWDGDNHRQMVELLGDENLGGHAGNMETAMVMALLPETVHMEYAEKEDCEPTARLKSIAGVSAPIEWYADYPNHYAGSPLAATAAVGKKMYEALADDTARIFAEIKNSKALAVQNEYFEICNNRNRNQ